MQCCIGYRHILLYKQSIRKEENKTEKKNNVILCWDVIAIFFAVGQAVNVSSTYQLHKMF